jgi:hypothetical protein
MSLNILILLLHLIVTHQVVRTYLSMKAIYIRFVLLCIYLFDSTTYAQTTNVPELDKIVCDSAPNGLWPNIHSCDHAFSRLSLSGHYSPNILLPQLVIREENCWITLRPEFPSDRPKVQWHKSLEDVPINWEKLTVAARRVFQECFTPMGHSRGGQTKPRFVESSKKLDFKPSSEPRFENSSGAVSKSLHGDFVFVFPPY